jgi:predicted transposase YbfD/YdcC
MDRFVECFEEVDDPRAANAWHDLNELLFIALLASLCGAQNCSDMSEFGRSKERLLRQFLQLEHGIPSHDTFSRVFRLLDPQPFEAAFRDFMGKFAEGLDGVVAVDGKALRLAYEKGQSHKPRMMVSAFAATTRLALANHLALGQDERTAVLQLIGVLSLKGMIVTADALHGHPAMAEAIIDQGGDYVLRLKANQPTLLREAKAALEGAGVRHAEAKDDSHGRNDTRIAAVVPAAAMALRHDIKGLQAVARIVSTRPGQKPEERYYLLSKCFGPKRLLAIARAHWAIENQLHWVLDVVLDEDLARSRKDNAPQNLAILRRLALNIARAHPDKKTSLRRKFLRAGWDDSYLFSMIAQMR